MMLLCGQCDSGRSDMYCTWCHLLTCAGCMPDGRVCTHCKTCNMDYRALAGVGEEYEDLV